MTRNALIQRIHVLKRELSLDDEIYREILLNISGKQSCKNIDDEYLNLIKQTLEGQLQKLQRRGVKQNSKEQAKIAKLGYLLGWSWFDIAHFVKKQTNGARISTRTCTKNELNKIICGMVAIIEDRLANGTLTMSAVERENFLKFIVNRNYNNKTQEVL